MKLTELQTMIERSMENAGAAITEKLMENVQKEVAKQFDEIVQQEQKKRGSNNPFYAPNKVTSQKMEEYMKTTFGTSGTQNKTYRGMFGKDNLSSDGFESLGEFLKTIHDGRADNRLITKVPSGLNEGIPSEGGFLVPSEYTAQLLDQSLENEIIRPRAQVYPMAGKTKQIPGVEISSHASSLFGGVIGYWADEGNTVPQTKPGFRLVELVAKKLMMLSTATNELLQDSAINFEQVLGGMLSKAIGWYLDDAFLSGHGGGRPLGLLNCPSTIEVAAETGQTSGTICYENCINMLARLHPGCYKNSIWIANLTTLPQLAMLYMAIGTAGVPVKVLQEETGKFTLIGKEVLFTEKTPTLGTKGDLILADLSQYAIGLREGLRIEKSNAPGFTTDESTWRTVARVDGQGLWDKPLTLKDGVTTVAPFVVLASR
jgi:HK97 family phage major capsid protein